MYLGDWSMYQLWTHTCINIGDRSMYQLWTHTCINIGDSSMYQLWAHTCINIGDRSMYQLWIHTCINIGDSSMYQLWTHTCINIGDRWIGPLYIWMTLVWFTQVVRTCRTVHKRCKIQCGLTIYNQMWLYSFRLQDVINECGVVALCYRKLNNETWNKKEKREQIKEVSMHIFKSFKISRRPTL